MKKLLLMVACVAFSFATMAQDGASPEAVKIYNEAGGAYKAKDYVKAAELFSNYINSGDEFAESDAKAKDYYQKSLNKAAADFYKKKNYTEALNYFAKYEAEVPSAATTDGKNAYLKAMSNYKLKSYDAAISEFGKVEEIYSAKADIAAYYTAICYGKKGDAAKKNETLTNAIAKYPTSKYVGKMKSTLTKPMLEAALVPYKAGSDLAQKAQGGDPEAYVGTMGKAVTQFKSAIGLFNEVLSVDAANAQAAQYIGVCEANIKAFNDYKASLKK